MFTKVCPICGKEFETKSSCKKYCSEECAYKAKLKPDRTIKACKNCGKEFDATGSKSVCCCDTCKEVYESKRKFPNIDECVVCEECGYRGANILKHVGVRHGSVDEYCEKHHCHREDLMSKKTRNNLSERQQKLMKEGKVKGFTSENNPSKGEGCKNGRQSPYSKNFKGYDGLTDEEKESKIQRLLEKKIQSTNDNCNNPKKIDYYLSRGMTIDEAHDALSKSQSTFSLEKCIEKYGEVEGYKRWKERQEKWISNYKKSNYSAISQELFWELYEIDEVKSHEVYFATLTDDKKKSETNVNYEYTLELHDKLIKPDFFIKDAGKIIEFDGDYWHNQQLPGNKERAEERDRAIIEAGFKVYHVKERDYRNDPEKVLEECLSYIRG